MMVALFVNKVIKIVASKRYGVALFSLSIFTVLSGSVSKLNDSGRPGQI